jgi:hypothetical protein
MTAELQYFRIYCCSQFSTCPKKNRSYKLEPGGLWSFFVTFRPRLASAEELEAAGLLVTYRPDYFVSGHNYAFPYPSGQSWNQKPGPVSVLMPGQIVGRAISEPHQTEYRIRRTFLANHQRDMDTGGRAVIIWC